VRISAGHNESRSSNGDGVFPLSSEVDLVEMVQSSDEQVIFIMEDQEALLLLLPLGLEGS